MPYELAEDNHTCRYNPLLDRMMKHKVSISIVYFKANVFIYENFTWNWMHCFSFTAIFNI